MDDDTAQHSLQEVEQNNLKLYPLVKTFESKYPALPNELGSSLENMVQEEEKNQDSRIKNSNEVVLPKTITEMLDSETVASINSAFTHLAGFNYQDTAIDLSAFRQTIRLLVQSLLLRPKIHFLPLLPTFK